MDADTIFRCLLEIQNNRDHWLDAIPLMRDELERSSSIQSHDREKLLQSLGEIEHANLAGREAIATAMVDILNSYPTFASESCDYISRKLADLPDDRRVD